MLKLLDQLLKSGFEVLSHAAHLHLALVGHVPQVLLALHNELIPLLLVGPIDSLPLSQEGLLELSMVAVDEASILLDDLARHVTLQLFDELLLLDLQLIEVQVISLGELGSRALIGVVRDVHEILVVPSHIQVNSWHRDQMLRPHVVQSSIGRKGVVRFGGKSVILYLERVLIL